MPARLFPLPRPLSVGEVLDAGFRLFRATLLACLPFAALAVLAGQLPNVYLLAAGGAQRNAAWWALNVVSFLLTLGLWSVVIVRQHAVASGVPKRHHSALREALRLLPPSAALTLLYGLAVAAGLVLLVLPGVYCAVALCFAWPALLVEGQGIRDAFATSLRLIQGYWWRTCVIFIAALAALFVFYALAGILGVVVATVTGPADFAVMTAVTTVMVVVLGAFIGPFYSALLLAAYEDLKLRKEGIDLERRIESLGEA